jgi:ring-1,2-phenylacetyl-CoA epoxidase subunit PaaE
VLAGEPDSSVTLLYANRNSASVMFRDDLNDLKDRYTTRFTLLHVMDEETQDVEIMNGRLDAEKLETWLLSASSTRKPPTPSTSAAPSR